jgi:hypothetical protein
MVTPSEGPLPIHPAKIEARLETTVPKNPVVVVVFEVFACFSLCFDVLTLVDVLFWDDLRSALWKE